MSSSGAHLKTYGESIAKVTREKFSKWANRLPGTATNKDIMQRLVWIVPAPFYAARYVNYGSYFPDMIGQRVIGYK